MARGGRRVAIQVEQTVKAKSRRREQREGVRRWPVTQPSGYAGGHLGSSRSGARLGQREQQRLDCRTENSGLLFTLPTPARKHPRVQLGPGSGGER